VVSYFITNTSTDTFLFQYCISPVPTCHMKDMMNEDNSDSEEDTTLAELARGTAAPARRLGTVAPTVAPAAGETAVAPAAGETAVAPAAGLSPLKKIWDDQFCNQCIVDNVPGWECLRGGKKFKPFHHT
jgi:hypothetical protein